MGDKSTIEWTDASWNPARGCVKVSPGCKHCYAETFAERFRGVPGHAYEQGFDPRLAREMLAQPLHWRKPRKVFVNSMSDLFGEFVPDGYILDCFRVMEQCPQHTFQILTKRADRMAAWFAKWCDVEQDGDPVMARGPEAVRAAHTSGRARLFADMIEGWGEPPGGAAYPTYDWMEGMRWWGEIFPNAWLGVSVEDRKYGLPRIEHLRKVPASVRFLSIEPLLEDVADDLDLTGIHWVIIGGESGNGARPMDLEWGRRVLAVCRRFGVPAFFKQAGARPIDFSRFRWTGGPHPGGGEWHLLSPKSKLAAQIWQNSPDHFTWHTWDIRGVGGENASDPSLDVAQAEVIKALRRQALRNREQWHMRSPLSKKGGDLAELPEDLRVREFPKGFHRAA